MVDEYDNYLNFIDSALELAKKIPRYFSKYSNKIYCNHQKLAIYVLMQKLRFTSREIVAFLRYNSDARLHLGLTRVPVHTTILRFAKKISKIIHAVLGIRTANNVAVDASGFDLDSKSFYYRTKWNSERKWKTKQHLKLSICIDTDNQKILTYRIRKKVRNDTIDFKYLLKKLHIKQVFADKGYDSKSNRQFVINKLKAMPVIPKRNYKDFYGYIKGKRKISGKDYHQRSKVETVFSVLKRKYGSIVRGRSYVTQQVEVISKMIAYNVDRDLKEFVNVFLGLHQSPKERVKLELLCRALFKPF